MCNQATELHAWDVVELCLAFRENRTHHRDHLRGILTKYFKKHLLENLWEPEIDFHQRRLYDLMVELDYLEYWDKDIWRRCFDSVKKHRDLNNIHMFIFHHQKMRQLNEDPKSPLFQTLDADIASLKEKHYNVNREWRYNYDTAEWRSYKEIKSKRENCKQEDQILARGSVDQTLISRAIEAERKMKRLRMAKYSPELFDEIVTEMMREKRTMMEMMAELDVEDEKIVESQQRIANKRLKMGIHANI